MGMSSWKTQWAELERLVTNAGFTGRWAEGKSKPPRFEIGLPATEQEIQQIESQLGAPIPQSMRRVLGHFSARVSIEWALPEGRRAPEMFRQIFAGECRWDMKALPKLQNTHRQWIEKCFTGKSTPDWPDKASDKRAIAYDLVWHSKFAFLEVGNGDMVGIDTAPGSGEPVVYLSHEDGPCHGFRLGQSFEDYVDRLTALAFVGAEDWQQEVFLPDAIHGLRVEGDVFTAWREWLGITASDT